MIAGRIANGRDENAKIPGGDPPQIQIEHALEVYKQLLGAFDELYAVFRHYARGGDAALSVGDLTLLRISIHGCSKSRFSYESKYR